MPTPLQIWLVEDEPAYRRSFEQLIDTTDEFDLAAAFESYDEVPTDVLPPPDLVVMDLQLPGINGTDATRDLLLHYPTTRVVMLTLVDAASAVFDALRAGAVGYVVKGTRPDQIFQSLREAHAGGTFFSPSVARHVLRFFATPTLPQPLSERERDVLAALAKGLSKSRIADLLFLSPHTVDSHLRSVYAKLQVHTAAEAAAKGVRLGVI